MNKDELFKMVRPKRLYQHKKRNQPGIYIIDSFETEKLYIGSTKNLSTRIWNDHYWALENNRHVNNHLQNHVNKYGLNDLAFYIIDICSKNELIDLEQWYLDNINKKIQFNITEKADISNAGRDFSECSRRKMSEARKGKKLSEEHKRKIRRSKIGSNNPNYNKTGSSNPNYGKRRSEEYKQKMSKIHTGKKHSEETKQKMGQSQKKRYHKNPPSPLKEETKNKISESLKGENHFWYGKNHSEETKKKMSQLAKQRWDSRGTTKEAREKIRKARQGRPLSEETKRKISENSKGKSKGPKSEETKRKISEAKQRKNNP